MKERIAKHLWSVIGLTAIGLLVTVPPARADDFDFEFNTNGVLPSAQGAIYSSDFGVPETSAFSVNGGLLHQNMLSGNQNAEYQYHLNREG